jgi:hypothetical protein
LAYFYEFELVLAGVILLSTMTFAGVRIWLKRKKELQEQKEYQNQPQ